MKQLNEIKQKIDEHEVISFDIFDTLLLRPYVKPTDLFLHMEKALECPGFAEIRIKAEQTARKIHSDKEDITLDDIYDEISSEYKDFKQKEIDFEKQVLQPNPQMKEVYDYAKKQNKRIIITSDMYLPQDFLKRILKNKGFDGFEKLYVSSEYKKTKWSGNLYKYILSDMSLTAQQILHIGDNKQSDYNKAKELGIFSVHISKAIDDLFNSNKRAKIFYENHAEDLASSVILGLISISLQFSNLNYWQNFGFVYGGPTILAYIKWIDEQAKKDKISDLFFVARDGYTLQKVYDIIKTTATKSHYFYGPRILNVICNMDYKNSDGFNTSVAPYLLLNYFKDKLPQLPNFEDINSCMDYLNENISIIRELCQNKKREYMKYISSFNCGNNPAIVDSCTLKFSGQKVLEAGLNKKIKGYYWIVLTDNGISEIYSAYQPEKNHTLSNWNLMELFMTAPTPPVKDLHDNNPVFMEESAWEKKRIEIYPDLSDGMVKFAQLYNQVFALTPLSIDYKTIVDWLNILCSIPTEEDKKQFVDVRHAGTMDHKEYEPLMPCWKNISKETPGFFDEKIKTIRIKFCGIPFIKGILKTTSTTIKLFNIIPIYKWINKTNKKTLKLFGVIPILKIKKKADGKSTYYRLFDLFTLIKIRTGEK